jgi:hypothetical protein
VLLTSCFIFRNIHFLQKKFQQKRLLRRNPLVVMRLKILPQRMMKLLQL